jgi:hypothetical protein
MYAPTSLTISKIDVTLKLCCTCSSRANQREDSETDIGRLRGLLYPASERSVADRKFSFYPRTMWRPLSLPAGLVIKKHPSERKFGQWQNWQKVREAEIALQTADTNQDMTGEEAILAEAEEWAAELEKGETDPAGAKPLRRSE